MPKYNDFLLCGISSNLRQYVNNFDEIIDENDSDFVSSGLLKSSVIRLCFLAVIPSKNIIGKIGFIDEKRYQRLLKNLSSYLLGELKLK